MLIGQRNAVLPQYVIPFTPPHPPPQRKPEFRFGVKRNAPGGKI